MITVIVVLIVVIGIGFLLLGKKKDTITDRAVVVKALSEIVAENRKTLPTKRDEYTTTIQIDQDGVRAIYTIKVDMQKLTNDGLSIEKTDDMVKGLCKSLKPSLEYGMEHEFRYVDMQLKPIPNTGFSISKDDCFI